jgi:hypothetical protein
MVEIAQAIRYSGGMAKDLESLADRFTKMGRHESSEGIGDEREAALAELQFADAMRRSAERLSQRSAELARLRGASWREIGEAVGGITPQGAEHRFSAAAKQRRSKASKVEWASKDRRRAPRSGSPADRALESDRT